MQMTNFAIASIPRVTGINVEAMGLAGSNPSSPNDPRTASQEYQRRQSATIVLASLFDSLRRYRRTAGRLLLYLIVNFLTDGRLIRIVGQEMDQYVPLVRDPNVIQYDVIVDDAPSAPSQKELVWNSMIQMLPMLQGINPPPQVMLTLLDYSPLPASLVAKIKAAVQQAQQAAQANPQPSPMDLIMAEKQADINANAQRRAADLHARQTEQALEVRHQQALAAIETRARIAQENIRLYGKHRDAQMANGGNFDPLTEGLIAGVKAGAQRFATELVGGGLAQRANMPLGMPTHLGQVPGQPEAPRPQPRGNGSQQ
jgi:hypothetical protein